MTTKGTRKVGLLVVGAASRANSLLPILVRMPDVRILGLAEPLAARRQKTLAALQPLAKKPIVQAADYRELLDLPGLDAVLALGSWNSHVQVCLDAMNAGKYAATEVGGACTLHECWQLVQASESNRTPCMMLENCCYGRAEMMVLNMVKMGLFGELIHAQCGYRHDLRVLAKQQYHFRLDHNLHRNGDLYLTHGVGPVMQWLGINHGNRFLAIRSTASKAVGWEDFISHNQVPDKSLRGKRFAMGDVISSTITCAHGETVDVHHCISLPGPYSRCGRLDGTKGCYSEDRGGCWLEGLSASPEQYDSMERLYPKYDHPMWRKYSARGIQPDSHGGMDFLVLGAFIDAVKKRTDTPINVYDTATLMALSVLSEESVALGGQPVPIPDFTKGKWLEDTSLPINTSKQGATK